ncbi:MAG: hypothetical protein H7836_09325 [Magnetococcus sp. YQC-3]
MVVDPAPLIEGLHWLESWDERPVLSNWHKPLRVLSSLDDQIVSPDMTRACFGDAKWLESGGHLLPLTKPEACAELITWSISK